MFGRRTALVLMVFGAALLAPGGASAATTFGEDLSIAPTASNAGTGITRAYMDDGSVNPGSPVGGVLTSVTFRSNGEASWGWVRVIRRTGPYVSGDADFVTLVNDIYWEAVADATPSGHTTTIPTRVTIQAGDQLAMVNANVNTNVYYLGSAPAECAYAAGAVVGAMVSYSTALCNHWIPVLQGTVEADADGDGYGDESQDLCPSDSTLQVACPAPPPALPPVIDRADLTVTIKRAKRPVPGLRATLLVKVTNNGPAAARRVKVSVDRARRLKSWSMLPSASCPLAVTKRSCEIESLAAGGSITLKARGVKRMSGKISLVARVSSPTSDPVATNNSSRTSVRFHR